MSMFLPSAVNILTSAIVIRMLVPEWWGQITVLQLYMYIGTQFCAWGNKDALMKLFSENPSKLKSLWMESFSGRLFLLIPAVIGSYFVAPNFISVLYLSSWIILRYFTQAFEAPILFTRNFKVNIVAELIGLIATIFLLIIFKNILSFNNVLLVITIGYFLKNLVQTFHYRTFFSFEFSFQPNYKKLAFLLPFMMLGFAGVMQQKSDMICVVWLSTKIEVAQYQVFSSFLIFMQSFPGLVAGPFVKNLYRLPKSSYPKIRKYFIGIGLIVSSLGIVLTYFVVTIVYHFELSFTLYLLGFLYGFLTYFYLLEIYLLFKNNKQQQVMMISVFSIVLNFILCFIFIPFMKIQGAVLANVLTQIAMFVLYKFYLLKNQTVNT